MHKFANHKAKSLQGCFRVQRGLPGFGSPRRLALRLKLGGFRKLPATEYSESIGCDEHFSASAWARIVGNAHLHAQRYRCRCLPRLLHDDVQRVDRVPYRWPDVSNSRSQHGGRRKPMGYLDAIPSLSAATLHVGTASSSAGCSLLSNCISFAMTALGSGPEGPLFGNHRDFPPFSCRPHCGRLIGAKHNPLTPC